MTVLGCILSSIALPALSLGGLGLMISSVATAFIITVVHVSAPKNEAFDEAVIEALESYKARNTTPKSPAEVVEITSRIS